MIKFVLVYALILNDTGHSTQIITTYASPSFCESVRKSLTYARNFKCIPHQEIVVVPAK